MSKFGEKKSGEESDEGHGKAESTLVSNWRPNDVIILIRKILQEFQEFYSNLQTCRISFSQVHGNGSSVTK